MLARIAHELFWLGRDLTRAEHTARTLDGTFHADVAGTPHERSISLSWEAVLTIIGGKPHLPREDALAMTALEDEPLHPDRDSSALAAIEENVPHPSQRVEAIEGNSPHPSQRVEAIEGNSPHPSQRVEAIEGNSPHPSQRVEAIGERPSLPDEDALSLALQDKPLGRNETARLLTLDTGSQASIVSCVARARARGRTLRDVVSTEMWQALNSFYLSLERDDLLAALQTGPYSFYREVKERCALFWGLVARTMLHDEGRAFLEAGARIEEADMVLRMLRVTVPEELNVDGYQTEALALLRAVGGLQAYRRAVRGAPTVVPVVRFLLYDSAYPGSVASSVRSLREALYAADAQPRSSAPVLRLGRLIAELELQRQTPDTGDSLQNILERVQDELGLVDKDIGERYFAIAALAAVHL